MNKLEQNPINDYLRTREHHIDPMEVYNADKEESDEENYLFNKKNKDENESDDEPEYSFMKSKHSSNLKDSSIFNKKLKLNLSMIKWMQAD